jgi:hypothetical protein
MPIHWKTTIAGVIVFVVGTIGFTLAGGSIFAGAGVFMFQGFCLGGLGWF